MEAPQHIIRDDVDIVDDEDVMIGNGNPGDADAAASSSSATIPGSGNGGMIIATDQIIDHLQAMMYQEDASYKYQSFFPPHLTVDELERVQLNLGWREKICQWTYNVVDHFDICREVVAISMNYFDRYLATRSNECSGNLALLASLTTLHIAIKVHSESSIKMSTLASLSRGQFDATHIERMEWQICQSLRWKLHPPTLFAFVSYFLMLFHPNHHQQQQNQQPSSSSDLVLPPLHHSVRKELFEVAIYMAELSVCDSFFVSYPSSTVAMAAIVNVMDDMPPTKLSVQHRTAFWTLVQSRFGFTLDPSRTQLGAQLASARQRLRAMYMTATTSVTTAPASGASAASGAGAANGNDDETRMETVDGCASYHSQKHGGANSSSNTTGGAVATAAPSPSSPTSTTEMNVDDTATIGSSTIGDYGGGGKDVASTSGRKVEIVGFHNSTSNNKFAKGATSSSSLMDTMDDDDDDDDDDLAVGSKNTHVATVLGGSTSNGSSPSMARDSNNLRYSPSPLSSSTADDHHQSQKHTVGLVTSASAPAAASQYQYNHHHNNNNSNIFASASPLDPMNCSPIVANNTR